MIVLVLFSSSWTFCSFFFRTFLSFLILLLSLWLYSIFVFAFDLTVFIFFLLVCIFGIFLLSNLLFPWLSLFMFFGHLLIIVIFFLYLLIFVWLVLLWFRLGFFGFFWLFIFGWGFFGWLELFGWYFNVIEFNLDRVIGFTSLYNIKVLNGLDILWIVWVFIFLILSWVVLPFASLLIGINDSLTLCGCLVLCQLLVSLLLWNLCCLIWDCVLILSWNHFRYKLFAI